MLKSGTRVALRRLSPRDLPTFQDYRNDPIVGQYQDWSVMTDDEAFKFLHAVEHDPLLVHSSWSQIAISQKKDNTLIGDIGIHLSEDESCSEIGFTLARQHWGKGYATEAVTIALDWIFEQTRATKIVGITDKENTASARVLLRVGMRHVKDYPTEFRSMPCIESLYEVNRPLHAANSN